MRTRDGEIGALRRLIREVILLLETKCPECGDPKAYVGLNSVECTRKGCRNFSQRHLAATVR